MKWQVNQIVVDLRAEPKDLNSQDYSHNPLRLTQLQYGEEVIIVEKKGEWVLIEAVEQPHFTKERLWHGYPGWVKLAELSPLVEKEKKPFLPFCREKLIIDAKSFLNMPYLWGGTAPCLKNPIASVDCSGLTYLLYKAQGLLIPRDAHDQYLFSQKIAKKDLQKGDLIFWSTLDDPERIKHVIVYLDKHHYLEAPYTGKNVRILPLPANFWEPSETCFFPDREKPYLVHTGKII